MAAAATLPDEYRLLCLTAALLVDPPLGVADISTGPLQYTAVHTLGEACRDAIPQLRGIVRKSRSVKWKLRVVAMLDDARYRVFSRQRDSYA